MSSNLSETMSKLCDSSIYSVILSFLYELRQIPEYSLLSELSFLCDKDSFLALIGYFQGCTIRIPTQEEFNEAISVLLLFQYYEIEHRDWKEAVVLSGFNTSSGKAAHNKLDKLKEMMNKYNFNTDRGYRDEASK